jgi:chaperonin GroES
LDRVLVERIVPQAKTSSGIVIPESAQEKLHEGFVLAVGPGRRAADGKLIETGLKAGDRVLLPQYGGNAVKLEGRDYILFRDEDILGVLKE